VLTVARPSPVAAATSPAVIASPLANASRTAVLVAPDALRVGALGASVLPAALEALAVGVAGCFGAALGVGGDAVRVERPRAGVLAGDG